MKTLLLLFFTATILNFANLAAYKILALFPMSPISHNILSSTLLKELSKRGHEITSITPYPEKSLENSNYKQISVEFVLEKLSAYKKSYLALEQMSVQAQAQFSMALGHDLTDEVIRCPQIQNLMRSGAKFDLILASHFLNEGLLGVAYHFAAPVVLLATMPLYSWAKFYMATPTTPAYSNNLISSYTNRMNFLERLKNSYYDITNILYHQFVILPKHRESVRRYIPNSPDLYKFLNNASLVLINSHPSIYDATPQAPNFIEIGGYHVKLHNELAPDLKEYLDNSKYGVIIYSMGTNLKISDLTNNMKKDIFKAFSKLKQNVIIKWDSQTIPKNVSRNLKFVKWLPQSDILAHPNVKAFISHGGLLSTIESIYFGVPLIGIPVFADQKMNMASLAAHGCAVVIPLQELTEHTLTAALEKVLSDKFRDSIKVRSQIMRDRPIKPLDNAIYWIEYVARHRGAPHLRYAGMDLYWYQRYLIDVAIFVIICILILWFIVKKLLRTIVEFIFKNAKDKRD